MYLGISEGTDTERRTFLERRPAPIEAPWYKGMGEGIVSGFSHGMAVSTLAATTDPDAHEKWEKTVRETRPDQVKIGTAGQLLHGLSTIAAYGFTGAVIGAPVGAAIGAAGGVFVGGVGALPGAAAGASYGASVGAVGSIGFLSGFDKYLELTDQGIDHSTALKAAGITGTVMTVGAGAPAYIGKTLGRQVLSGVGINEVLGITERGATGEILRNSNYEKVAEHYKALDAQGMVLDALLGAAFPLGGRLLGGRKARIEDIDAAFTLEQDIAAQTRNPSIESSLEKIQALKENLTIADRQIMAEGRTVSDVDLPRASTDVPNPEYAEMTRKMEGEINESIYRDTGLTREDWDSDIQRAIELDNEIKTEITDRVSKVDDTSPVGEDMTPDVFARKDADLVAQAFPDARIRDENGNTVRAENFGEYVDGLIKQGDEDAFLHNVAIACSLTHGEQ
jgi:hypothetical protein